MDTITIIKLVIKVTNHNQNNNDKKVDSSYVSVRIDGKTKQLAREKLAKRGLSISAYIRLMLTDVAESGTVTYPGGRKL